MEGRQVWHTDHEMPADFKNTGDFVQHPKDFFDVLKDLVAITRSNDASL
jgi:hypothetical protein